MTIAWESEMDKYFLDLREWVHALLGMEDVESFDESEPRQPGKPLPR